MTLAFNVIGKPRESFKTTTEKGQETTHPVCHPAAMNRFQRQNKETKHDSSQKHQGHTNYVHYEELFRPAIHSNHVQSKVEGASGHQTHKTTTPAAASAAATTTATATTTTTTTTTTAAATTTTTTTATTTTTKTS